MAEQPTNQTIKLISCDNKEFIVNQQVAFASELIKQLSNVNPETSNEIMIPDVNGEVLAKVIQFCEYHLNNPMKEIEKPLKSNNMLDNVSSWDAEFIDMDDTSIFQVVTAANYLMIQPLLDLACAKIASYIKGKSTDEIRQRFHIESDFTPQEEEKIRQDNKWADDL